MYFGAECGGPRGSRCGSGRVGSRGGGLDEETGMGGGVGI